MPVWTREFLEVKDHHEISPGLTFTALSDTGLIGAAGIVTESRDCESAFVLIASKFNVINKRIEHVPRFIIFAVLRRIDSFFNHFGF